MGDVHTTQNSDTQEMKRLLLPLLALALCPPVQAVPDYAVVAADTYCKAMQAGMGRSTAAKLMTSEIFDGIYVDDYLVDFRNDEELAYGWITLQISKHEKIGKCGNEGSLLDLME